MNAPSLAGPIPQPVAIPDAQVRLVLMDHDPDPRQIFEARAEKAGNALSDLLAKLDTAPQHIRDREYIELIRDIFTGSKWGRNRLHALLEEIAQDGDHEPSELLVKWHGARS